MSICKQVFSGLKRTRSKDLRALQICQLKVNWYFVQEGSKFYRHAKIFNPSPPPFTTYPPRLRQAGDVLIVGTNRFFGRLFV